MEATRRNATPPRGVEELRDKASDLKDNLSDLGTAARHAATDSMTAVRDTATAYFDEGRERANQIGHQLEEQIRRNPVPSLLIAAGVGLVAGLILCSS